MAHDPGDSSPPAERRGRWGPEGGAPLRYSVESQSRSSVSGPDKLSASANTHTGWWWEISSTLAGLEVCKFFCVWVLPCWSHGECMRDLLVWNEEVGHWWLPCYQKSPPPPPPVADSMAGFLLYFQLMCWTASHHDTASGEHKEKQQKKKSNICRLKFRTTRFMELNTFISLPEAYHI